MTLIQNKKRSLYIKMEARDGNNFPTSRVSRISTKEFLEYLQLEFKAQIPNVVPYASFLSN